MKAPDWYDDWKHDAIHQLMDKQDALKRDYGMGDWPRWDYDADAGTLVFSQDGEAKVMQISRSLVPRVQKTGYGLCVTHTGRTMLS